MYSLNDVASLWYSMFFSPQYATVLALCRICLSIICILKVYSLWQYASEYLGPDGWYPYSMWKNSHEARSYFCLFHCLKASLSSVYLMLMGLLISSISLLLGFYTEVSALFVYLFWISISHRNIYIFNSGDSLLRILLFLLIFSGSGYALSLDNYIHHRDQFYTTINPWVWRLMQFCIINLYLQSVYTKINYGKDWRNGTALYYALNNRAFNRYRVGERLNKTMAYIGNYGTLIVEAVAPVGLCFKETNVASLLMLFMLHVGCEGMLRIGLFGIIMMAGLVLFIDPIWGADAMKWLSQFIITG